MDRERRQMNKNSAIVIHNYTYILSYTVDNIVNLAVKECKTCMIPGIQVIIKKETGIICFFMFEHTSMKPFMLSMSLIIIM